MAHIASQSTTWAASLKNRHSFLCKVTCTLSPQLKTLTSDIYSNEKKNVCSRQVNLAAWETEDPGLVQTNKLVNEHSQNKVLQAQKGQAGSAQPRPCTGWRSSSQAVHSWLLWRPGKGKLTGKESTTGCHKLSGVLASESACQNYSGELILVVHIRTAHSPKVSQFCRAKATMRILAR